MLLLAALLVKLAIPSNSFAETEEVPKSKDFLQEQGALCFFSGCACNATCWGRATFLKRCLGGSRKGVFSRQRQGTHERSCQVVDHAWLLHSIETSTLNSILGILGAGEFGSLDSESNFDTERLAATTSLLHDNAEAQKSLRKWNML